MKKLFALLLAATMCACMFGCNNNDKPSEGNTGNDTKSSSQAQTPSEGDGKKDHFLIGMSQCNLGEPYRVAMNDQIAAAAEQYPEFEVVFADAAQDNSKQVSDVENFITQKVDLLIISPNEAKPLTAVVKKAYDAGIPVIVLDRKVDGDAYTQFIGGDNKAIGKAAGDYVNKLLGEKGGKVVEIKGLEGATPQQERHDGFMEGIKDNPNIEIIYSQSCDWLRDKAVTVMEAALQANPEIDVVFSHNDPGAIGAYIAAQNAGRESEMKFIGIDGLPTPDGGIQEVINGKLEATYVYPTCGPEAIESAYKLLVKGETLDKEWILSTTEITKDNAEEMLKKFGG